ncbi:hypothetical protein SLE2022_293720 [Rubroshorea leprosula]
MGVVAGLLVQNTLKFLLKFGHVSPYLGYTTETIYSCKASPEAAAKAKREAEASATTETPLHTDNEWNISVVDDSELKRTDAVSSDALPEGLIHELPVADKNDKLHAAGSTTDTATDDLEDLRKQLDALNADQ